MWQNDENVFHIQIIYLPDLLRDFFYYSFKFLISYISHIFHLFDTMYFSTEEHETVYIDSILCSFVFLFLLILTFVVFWIITEIPILFKNSILYYFDIWTLPYTLGILFQLLESISVRVRVIEKVNWRVSGGDRERDRGRDRNRDRNRDIKSHSGHVLHILFFFSTPSPSSRSSPEGREEGGPREKLADEFYIKSYQ